MSQSRTRNSTASVVIVTPDQPIHHSKASFHSEHDSNIPHAHTHPRHSQLSVRSTASSTNLAQNNKLHAASSSSSPLRQRSSSADPHPYQNGRFHQAQSMLHHLPPIPDVTDRSSPPSPVSRKSRPSTPVNGDLGPPKMTALDSPNGKLATPRQEDRPPPLVTGQLRLHISRSDKVLAARFASAATAAPIAYCVSRAVHRIREVVHLGRQPRQLESWT